MQYKKHGFTGGGKRHPLYNVWHGMRSRCLSKTDKSYPRYGGRGIKVCKQWSTFTVFHDWAIKAGWKPGLMFDREDNDGNYTPKNCRFVSVLVSNRNRSNCITISQAIEVHELLDSGASNSTIAKTTGIRKHTVENIRDGACWRKDQLVPCGKQ